MSPTDRSYLDYFTMAAFVKSWSVIIFALSVTFLPGFTPWVQDVQSMFPSSKTGVFWLVSRLEFACLFLVHKCFHNSPNLKSYTSGVEWQLC